MDLSIRRMRKEDLGWLYRLLSDPEVMRWLEPPYSMEIGWVLLHEYWGRGYASALTDLLIQRAGQERRQLVIECAPQQQATKCIAVRKGFRYQGLIDGLDVYRLE